MNPAHSHPPDARDISHVMVSTYPKSSSHQHCSTPQVYSPDRIQASQNLHQPECLPSNSLSATRPLGSAYHLYLQHIACCYTLQLHSFKRRQSSTSACKRDSRVICTLQGRICATYHDRGPHTAYAVHCTWYVVPACSRQAVMASGRPHSQHSASMRFCTHPLLPQPLRLPSSRVAAISMSISIVSR